MSDGEDFFGVRSLDSSNGLADVDDIPNPSHTDAVATIHALLDNPITARAVRDAIDSHPTLDDFVGETPATEFSFTKNPPLQLQPKHGHRSSKTKSTKLPSKPKPKPCKRKKIVSYPSSSSSESETSVSSAESLELPNGRKFSPNEGRPHPLVYAIGRSHDSDPTGVEEETNPAGSVQRALTYVNGRSRKLRRINYPTTRVAMHNSLIWLLAKGAMKTLRSGMFGLPKDIRLAKLWGSAPPTHHNLDKVSRLLDKEAKIVNGVINTLAEITQAADHEITMARVCNDNGFEMVQDFEGDDLYSQDALKRVEKLKRNKKQPPSTSSLRPFSGDSRCPVLRSKGRGRGYPVHVPTQGLSKFDRGRGTPPYSESKPGTCHSCGLRGHWQRDCLARNRISKPP